MPEPGSIVWWGERPYLVIGTFNEPTVVLETPSGHNLTVAASTLQREAHT